MAAEAPDGVGRIAEYAAAREDARGLTIQAQGLIGRAAWLKLSLRRRWLFFGRLFLFSWLSSSRLFWRPFFLAAAAFLRFDFGSGAFSISSWQVARSASPDPRRPWACARSCSVGDVGSVAAAQDLDVGAFEDLDFAIGVEFFLLGDQLERALQRDRVGIVAFLDLERNELVVVLDVGAEAADVGR